MQLLAHDGTLNSGDEEWRTREELVLHIVRDTRGEVLGGLAYTPAPTTLQLSPVPYPDFILETAAYLDDATEPTAAPYYLLWELLLTHWFPPSESFTIEHQWKIPYSESINPSQSEVTYVVLFESKPLVLLQIHPPSLYTNPYACNTTLIQASRQFDQVAPYSPFHRLYVIAAMGKRWRAFRRSPYLTSEEAESLPGGDDMVDWMDDVVSEASYDVLKRHVEIMKSYVGPHSAMGADGPSNYRRRTSHRRF